MHSDLIFLLGNDGYNLERRKRSKRRQIKAYFLVEIGAVAWPSLSLTCMKQVMLSC